MSPNTAALLTEKKARATTIRRAAAATEGPGGRRQSGRVLRWLQRRSAVPGSVGRHGGSSAIEDGGTPAAGGYGG